MGNMEIWDKLRTPPKEALSSIKGGRLSGMTDIKPQWRYKMMTEIFGMCGIGWKYEIAKQWTEEGTAGARFCFVNVSLYVSVQAAGEALEWSDPIPGTGGSQLIAKEKSGLHDSDEGYKMATTDALSVAMKMLGVGSDIYMGMADSKYSKPSDSKSSKPSNGKSFSKTLEEDHKMLVEMYGEEEKEYVEGLQVVTKWVNKQKDEVAGLKSLKNIGSEAQAKVVHGKIKTAYKEWSKLMDGTKSPTQEALTPEVCPEEDVPF